MTDAQLRKLLARPRAKRTPRPPAQSEASLLRQVLAWLKAKRVFHWRANSGAGLRRGRGGRTVPVRANPAGTPDVFVLLPTTCGVTTRVLGLELKSSAGRLRDSQRAWAERAAAVGARVCVLRSFDEFLDAMRSEGVS